MVPTHPAERVPSQGFRQIIVASVTLYFSKSAGRSQWISQATSGAVSGRCSPASGVRLDSPALRASVPTSNRYKCLKRTETVASHMFESVPMVPSETPPERATSWRRQGRGDTRVVRSSPRCQSRAARRPGSWRRAGKCPAVGTRRRHQRIADRQADQRPPNAVTSHPRWGTPLSTERTRGQGRRPRRATRTRRRRGWRRSAVRPHRRASRRPKSRHRGGCG